jgi:pimeloyl-ACP methyl ester carboxylesterase
MHNKSNTWLRLTEGQIVNRVLGDLVLLHGGNHGSWCWSPLVAELERAPRRFSRILRLDTPGAGSKRDRQSDALTIADIARELNEELRAADVRRATFAGHSLAGVLMPVMAAEDPGLFHDLIFLQTSAPREGQNVLEQMYEQTGFEPASREAAAQPGFRQLFGMDLNAEQLRWLRTEIRHDHTPRALAEEPVSRRGYDPQRFRTAYVLAKRDPVLPPASQRLFAERLGCQRIIEIDTPHLPFISHPKLTAETLLSLVD